MARVSPISLFLMDTKSELLQKMEKFPPMESAQEAWTVLYEEVDELWEEVRKGSEGWSEERLYRELVQIAAMACRMAFDLRLKED